VSHAGKRKSPTDQPGNLEAVTSTVRSPLKASLPQKEALNMKRTAIAAQGIAQVGYEDGSEILEIEFTSGRVFQFFNVPQKMFNQLMVTPYKEVYYESNIYERFPYKRIE
jgi:hypothetical protein